ncbi:o-succinylbenzoate synthase [Phycisphaerae bacterium]|nr:o-succinylbenzoate synthase [Phycisphaerae bacterium]
MNLEMLRVSLPVLTQARQLVGVDAREIIFVAMRDQELIGFGECAPLPGLHSESLEFCMESIENWSNGLCEMKSLAPSAVFALSCAMETLNGFGARPVAPAKVANFFPGTFAQCDQAAIDSLSGAKVIKIKFGRDSESNDRALLSRLCNSLPAATFRIDGNRLLSRDECVARLQGVDASRVEYLEDPLRDPSQLGLLAKSTGIAIALDETVLDQSAQARALCESLSHDGCVAAWILRMSLIGSLDAIRTMAANAASLNADAVLSTAYESSYSLRVSVHLAASIPNATRAHGIGTASLLAQDSCEPAIARDGFIDGAPLPTPFAEAWL